MRNFSSEKNRRVVVTGLGVVSSLGLGWQEFWKNLLAGKSGISRIESFDTTPYDRHYGGEVKNFDPTQFMSKRKAEKIGRTSQMAIAAAMLALEDGNLEFRQINRNATSICIGTTAGEIGLLENYGDYRLNNKIEFDTVLFSVFSAGSISASVARHFKIFNKNMIFSTACASGNYSLAYAFEQIKSSKVDCAIVGGADAFSRIVFTGFERIYAIDTEKCRPFDNGRKGMIPGEGAGMVLLESLESALKRNAPIYAEIIGYGLSCDAYRMTEPKVNGIVKALNKTLTSSAIRPEDVDYISAHGTGTVENDEAECKAINRVFGEKTKDIPVSSIKSMLGHTMGAASAFGAIACCLAIQHNAVPPTINHEKDDPKCAIDCVPNVSREHKVRIALNNSQAFGGNNASVIFKEA